MFVLWIYDFDVFVCWGFFFEVFLEKRYLGVEVFLRKVIFKNLFLGGVSLEFEVYYFMFLLR